MDRRPLWAPWRIDYILGPKEGACSFCSAGAGGDDVKAGVLDCGAHCFTMLNAYPYASGHVMVSPYRHVGGLDQLDDDESLELMRLARRAIAALRIVMSPDGFNAGLNPWNRRRRRIRRSPSPARRPALARRHQLHARPRRRPCGASGA